MRFSNRKILITVVTMLILSASSVNAVPLDHYRNNSTGGAGTFIYFDNQKKEQEKERRRNVIITALGVGLTIFCFLMAITRSKK